MDILWYRHMACEWRYRPRIIQIQFFGRETGDKFTTSLGPRVVDHVYDQDLNRAKPGLVLVVAGRLGLWLSACHGLLSRARGPHWQMNCYICHWQWPVTGTSWVPENNWCQILTNWQQEGWFVSLLRYLRHNKQFMAHSVVSSNPRFTFDVPCYPALVTMGTRHSMPLQSDGENI